MKGTFIPSHPTIQELEQEATECEKKAEQESEPFASIMTETIKL